MNSHRTALPTPPPPPPAPPSRRTSRPGPAALPGAACRTASARASVTGSTARSSHKRHDAPPEPRPGQARSRRSRPERDLDHLIEVGPCSPRSPRADSPVTRTIRLPKRPISPLRMASSATATRRPSVTTWRKRRKSTGDEDSAGSSQHTIEIGISDQLAVATRQHLQRLATLPRPLVVSLPRPRRLLRPPQATTPPTHRHPSGTATGVTRRRLELDPEAHAPASHEGTPPGPSRRPAIRRSARRGPSGQRVRGGRWPSRTRCPPARVLVRRESNSHWSRATLCAAAHPVLHPHPIRLQQRQRTRHHQRRRGRQPRCDRHIAAHRPLDPSLQLNPMLEQPQSRRPHIVRPVSLVRRLDGTFQLKRERRETGHGAVQPHHCLARHPEIDHVSPDRSRSAAPAARCSRYAPRSG